MTLDRLSQEELRARECELDATYQRFREAGLTLDLTRGKPNPAQLALSDGLDTVAGGLVTADGTDTRNYGGVDGLPEARALGAAATTIGFATMLTISPASIRPTRFSRH